MISRALNFLSRIKISSISKEQKDLSAFINSNRIPGTVLLGNRATLNHFYGKNKRIVTLPSTFVINGLQEVIYQTTGYEPQHFSDSMRDVIKCNTVACSLDSSFINYKRKHPPRKIEDVAFHDLSGSSVMLSNITQSNSLLIVEFWATWCQPCLVAFEAMDNLLSGFNGDQVRMVAVNID